MCSSSGFIADSGSGVSVCGWRVAGVRGTSLNVTWMYGYGVEQRCSIANFVWSCRLQGPPTKRMGRR